LWFVATRAIHLRHGRIVSFEKQTNEAKKFYHEASLAA